MAKISRRDSIKYTILAGLATGLLPACKTDPVESEVHDEHHHHESPDGLYGLSEEDLALLEEKFFTDTERETVRVLANLIIPADDRSGNAEEAGTVEFIEFMMLDQPRWQVPIRGGLNWLTRESLKRFDQTFTAIAPDQQKQILDDIAYPEIAAPEFSQGVAFFNLFRNFVATGFWTSIMGVKDLQYLGNQPTHWDGAPEEWLARLGVSYED